MSVEPTLAWLTDREEIRALPQRYARAVDARDREALGALFDPDGTVDGARGLQQVVPYLDAMCNGPRAFEVSMHVFADPLIELTPGADAATVDTYATVFQIGPTSGQGDDLELGVRYVDQVVRLDGRWVVRTRTATTLWMRSRPR